MKIALKVDVDTLRGTREGVPRLLRIMKKHGVRSAFFFSAGPDNMGRHLWRLLKPAFLVKMMRTKAASLYGWDILFKGTFWPGPLIAKRCADVLRDTAADGHEIGVHAWDHHAWQAKAERQSAPEIARDLERACDAINDAAGRVPGCSAAPAWKCSDAVLEARERFPFRYNSDCRGDSIFVPVVNGKRLSAPQMPLSMPTYDELLGRDGVTGENYNERLLSFAKEGAYNLLTIHAEAEGGVCSGLFERFLELARARGIELVAPEELLPADSAAIPSGRVVIGEIPGREGSIALERPL